MRIYMHAQQWCSFTAVFHFRIHFTHSDPAPGSADPDLGIFSTINKPMPQWSQIRTVSKGGRIRNKVLRPPPQKKIQNPSCESSNLCLLLACFALVGVWNGRGSGLVRAGLFTWRTADGGALRPRDKGLSDLEHSISVSDPECLSRIRIFPSRIQGKKYSGSASKDFGIFNPKNCF